MGSGKLRSHPIPFFTKKREMASSSTGKPTTVDMNQNLQK